MVVSLGFVPVNALLTRRTIAVPPISSPWQTARRVCMCQKPGEDTDEGTSSSDPANTPRVSADWRLFRANLVEREAKSTTTPMPNLTPTSSGSGTGKEEQLWAHTVSHVEPGCLLVAQPKYFSPEPDAYFAETVIFVLNHGETGTLGLILNKPLVSSLASIPSDTSTPLGEAFHLAKAEFFCTNPLFNGGPMGLDSLMVIHDKCGLPDALKVIDGVYSGGLLGAINAVRAGQMKASSVKFFAGYSGWMAGQLDREIAEGTWFVVASSPQYVTEFQDGSGKGKAMWLALLRELNLAPND